MTRKEQEHAIEWLMSNAGPIIRWRLVRDFGLSASEKERRAFEKAALETAEVRRWLGNLGKGGIHGSKDTHAENALAKLIEYGVQSGHPGFDAKVLPYAEKVGRFRSAWDPIILTPFLIGAGYCHLPAIREWFLKRLAVLEKTARKKDYDLYLSSHQMRDVPKAWRQKPVYRPEFNNETAPLPSCYDLYALAHWPYETPVERKKAEGVVAYLSHPAFQSTRGGYLWDLEKKTCYAAGRVWLACSNPDRKVLFLGLGARFRSARKATWFKDGMADLEKWRTDRGTYVFPPDYLKEKRDSYYIYVGAHMGLGENRRNKLWREIESTFHMLNIRRLSRAR